MMADKKQLPSDEGAEQALLGCVLLESERVMFLLNELKFIPEMFYSLAHRIIFLTMQGMVSKRRHIDAITLIERLRAKGHAQEIGGMAYLNKLLDISCNWTAAPSYAEQLIEKYRLRSLVGIAKATELAVYDDRKSGDISAEMIANLMKQQDVAIDHDVEAIQNESMNIAKVVHEGGARPGWPSFLEPLNSILGSYVPKHVYIVAGTPSNGKTTLVSNEIVHKAVNLGVPSAFFSLEMAEREIRQNMAATLAGVDAFKFFLLGHYTDVEADAMKDAYSMLLKAPLHIIDRRMTIEQISSRIMFLVKKHGVRFFGLDYLQLIRYTRDTLRQSRNDQVAEWSAALHENAERFDFVLLLVSQLSRMGIKTRDVTPLPPTLESLRDCLSINTTKLWTPSGVLCNTSSRMDVCSYNMREGVKVMKSSNITKTNNALISVKLRSGRQVDCSPNHPILTDRGWTKAKDLTPESSIACVRRIPEGEFSSRRVIQARWMGWMLGNGSMLPASSPSFSCSCSVLSERFERETERLFGITPRVHPHWCKNFTQWDIAGKQPGKRGSNACANWLKANNMWGKRAHEKVIPSWFMEQADNHSIAELIGGLFDTDGTVIERKATKTCLVKYSTASVEMGHQVLWCLARLGVFGHIHGGYLNKTFGVHSVYSITISAREVEVFKSKVNLVGRKNDRLQKYRVSWKQGNFSDRLGTHVAALLLETARSEGWSQDKFGYRDQGKRISKSDLKLHLSKLKNTSHLDWMTNDDIYWDQLRSLSSAGRQKVFDRSVPVTHNFIANGIICHNSGCIEQDADGVIFIYKKPGEPYENFVTEWPMEIDVAKHRGGPVGAIKAVFRRNRQKFVSEDDFKGINQQQKFKFKETNGKKDCASTDPYSTT